MFDAETEDCGRNQAITVATEEERCAVEMMNEMLLFVLQFVHFNAKLCVCGHYALISIKRKPSF